MRKEKDFYNNFFFLNISMACTKCRFIYIHQGKKGYDLYTAQEAKAF